MKSTKEKAISIRAERKSDVYKPKNHIRIVTAASLFDGHDAAINIMRRIMQSTGVEVIHLGHNRSVQEIVDCAIQEDVQAIAVTSYQGGHMEFFKYMYDLLQEKGCGHIKIFGGGGGTILPSEIKELETYGITRIYHPDDGRELGLQGMINDLVSTLLYNQNQIQIQIVSFARVATPEFPQYRILAAGNSDITSVADLKGVEIGISEGSVIEYTTYRLLEAEGFRPEDIKTIPVPRIDLRMSLLQSGELKAANLPDPLASLAIQGGARLILDDTRHPEFGNSVISFRKSVIDAHPQAIRGFLVALEKAAKEVNADAKKWENLLSEQKLVPQPLIGSYQIPGFPTGSLPSEAQWVDVQAWALEKGLISSEVSYKDSVTDDYLP